MKLSYAIIAFFLSHSAIAADPIGVLADPQMAPEFTFTRPSWISPGTGKIPGLSTSAAVVGEINDRLGALRKHYEADCPSRDCRVVDRALDLFGYKAARFDLVFDDGWILHFTEDPHVIEVKSTRATASTILQNESRLQARLFDVMKKHGLKPSPYYGSGHFNIDLESAFRGDPKRLVNWLTDYFNHPALALGIFELDPLNAPAFVTLTTAQKDAYEKIVAQVFRGEISTVEDVIRRVNSDVYLDHTKYHSIRLHPERLEIRAVRAQSGADEFSLLATLFQKRIQLTNRLTDEGQALAVLKNVGINSPSQAFSQFFFYVTDAGVTFDPYRKFLRGPFLFGSLDDRATAFRDRGICGSLFIKTLDVGLKFFDMLYAR